MSQAPLVSVVLPIYKVEQWLRRGVDSVLAQTFRDFELILVDDGSPDNCGAICDEYAAADPRVRVIHQKNQGVSRARNVGIEQARGRWLVFLDPDDVASPGCWRQLSPQRKNIPGIALSGGSRRSQYRI